jgi:hypothetical protein
MDDGLVPLRTLFPNFAAIADSAEFRERERERERANKKPPAKRAAPWCGLIRHFGLILATWRELELKMGPSALRIDLGDLGRARAGNGAFGTSD